MGYCGHTATGSLRRAKLSCGKTPWRAGSAARALRHAGASTPRAAFVFVLLVSFVLSTLLSISQGVAAETPYSASHDMTAHHMIGSHEMTGPRDMVVSHDMTAHEIAAQKPCDHGPDCKCHDRLMSHCCAHATPVAAIWTSLALSPQLRAERCADVHPGYLHYETDNPPTPPPRSLLG